MAWVKRKRKRKIKRKRKEGRSGKTKRTGALWAARPSREWF
jgi:hypothetical protein